MKPFVRRGDRLWRRASREKTDLTAVSEGRLGGLILQRARVARASGLQEWKHALSLISTPALQIENVAISHVLCILGAEGYRLLPGLWFIEGLHRTSFSSCTFTAHMPLSNADPWTYTKSTRAVPTDTVSTELIAASWQERTRIRPREREKKNAHDEETDGQSCWIPR